jgi:hypothetical protein
VLFGAKCTVLVSHKYGKGKRKEPWRERALAGYIIGKNEEIKGYKVYIPSKSGMVTSQHVRNIKCMSEEQNNILKRLMKPMRPAGVEEQTIPRSEQRSETSLTGGSTASEGENEDRASEGDEVTPEEEEARLQEEWNRPVFVPRKPNEEDVEVIKKAMSNRIPKPTPKPVAEAPSTGSQGMVTRGRAKQMTCQVNSVIHKDPKNFHEAKNSALWCSGKRVCVKKLKL